MRGAPTVAGTFGSAWLCEPPTGYDKPHATLVTWQVNRPKAHPWWSWWAISLVHLRPIEGVKPAHKKYPEAEFELMFLALDPGKPVPDPIGGTDYAYLTPIDLVAQFHGVTEAQAVEMVKKVVELIVINGASPDSDYRSWWENVVKITVEHIAIGSHPKEKA